MGGIIAKLAAPTDATRASVVTFADRALLPVSYFDFTQAHTACSTLDVGERGRMDFEHVDGANLRRFVLLLQGYAFIFTLRVWSYAATLRLIAPPIVATDQSDAIAVYLGAMVSGWVLLFFVLMLVIHQNLRPSHSRDFAEKRDEEVVIEDNARSVMAHRQQVFQKKYSALRFRVELSQDVAQHLEFDAVHMGVKVRKAPLFGNLRRRLGGGGGATDENHEADFEEYDLTGTNDDETLPPDPDRPKDWATQRTDFTFMLLTLCLWTANAVMMGVDWHFYIDNPRNPQFSGFYWISFLTGFLTSISVPWWYYQKKLQRYWEFKERKEEKSPYSDFLFDED